MVNSSQGGGSKDTWVLNDIGCRGADAAVARGSDHAVARRRQPLLDEPVPRAGRAHGAARQRQPEPHARPGAAERRGTGGGCWPACPTPPPWAAQDAGATARSGDDGRPGEPRVDCRLRGRRARERPAGARGDQLRDVGGAQPALPARSSQPAEEIASGRPAPTSSCTADCGAHLVPGHDRRDDDARRRLAVHSAGPVPRARSATAALLDVQFREFAATPRQASGVTEYVEWVGLLKSCCAFEAYCRHYTADIRPMRIAEFLLLNADFPGRFASPPRRCRHRCKALAVLPAGQRPRRTARRPAAGVARLRPGRRDLRRAAFVTCRTSCARRTILGARCTSSTSRIRSIASSPGRRMCPPLRDHSPHAVQL